MREKEKLLNKINWKKFYGEKRRLTIENETKVGKKAER